MQVSHGGRQAGVKSEHRTKGNYTGECWVDTILEHPVGEGKTRGEDTIRIYSVFFQPGHRTDWHHHTQGQYLYVTGGEGRIANDKGESAVLRAGDWAYVPAGERHWHGAGPGNFFQNVVISLGQLIYDEKVNDEEYNRGFR